MIFSIVILIAVGAIAFFHYTQGFFSAALSALFAMIAAVLAISYHEPLVNALLAGRVADQAHAIALVVLFAGIYLMLRVVSDKVVPGNIRLPALLDKVGAGAMGVVAGVFGVGVVAVAAQTLPLGPSIAQYTPYETVSREANIRPRGVRQPIQTGPLRHEVVSERFDSRFRTPMWLPVDNYVIDFTAHLSDGGSLAGRRPLREVHPDYLQQLFGQRLGIEPGARITALIKDDRRDVRIDGVFQLTTAPPQRDHYAQLDARETVRTRAVEYPLEEEMNGQALVVVRVLFTAAAVDASDTDSRVRFSPGSVRLVAGRTNYYPIGTLENGQTLYANRIDDPLFIDLRGAEAEDRGADLVFLVDRENAIDQSGDDVTLADDAFIEVKRMARVSLSGQRVETEIEPDPRIQVMRRPE